MYSVIDLFSGAGGLSLGFQLTKKFNIKVAYENNINAQKTYLRNHPEVEMFGDINQADYKKLLDKYGSFDVVIGGPPCQGFSNANRQKNYAISQNNMLVKQFIRAIIELQPKAFVMENVGMLKSDVHRFYMTTGDEPIVSKYNIKVDESEIQLLDKKFYFDGALNLIQNKDSILKNLWTPSDYSLINNIYRHKNNIDKLNATLIKHKKKLEVFVEKFKTSNQIEVYTIRKANNQCVKAIEQYSIDNEKSEDIVNNIEPALMYQRMLGKALEFFENDIIVKKYKIEHNLIAVVQSFAVYEYLTKILSSKENGYIIDSGVLCAADFGVPQKRMRFVVMGIKNQISKYISLPKGQLNSDQYTTVKDAISDISSMLPVYDISEDIGVPFPPIKVELSDLASKLRDAGLLFNHIITETRDIPLKRFAAIKQGQNFHSLDSSMKENTYTDVSRTQNTIYLRLDYNEPSGTVVNVRKSMWIHPEHNRAVSVREAARLQTFPDSFVFEGTKDSQYQQVGNAVPPMLAEAIANELAITLDNCDIYRDTKAV